MAGNMKVSTGSGDKAVSVRVSIPEPTTVSDPQWEAWNCSEADVCALAVRQVRVDIANGGARNELREAVKRGEKGDALKARVQAFVNDWRRGSQHGRKVMDARGIGLNKDQVAHFEAKGFTVLTN